jgi:putative sterol carrier protein
MTEPTTTHVRPTEAFFAALGAKGRDPHLAHAAGTVRFEVTGGPHVERWSVVIDHGDVTVSRRRLRADAVVKIDRDAMDRLVTGRSNAMAAAVRGELTAEGDLALVLLLQRIFPAPPGQGLAATGAPRTNALARSRARQEGTP